MKKFLLPLLGLFLFSLGFLFAQSTAPLSIIEKMKAASHDFTLMAELNPGQTGLKSGPLTGKKTGEMVTAEEYNRILELFAEGSSLKGKKCADEEYLQGFNDDGTILCKKFPVSINLSSPRGLVVDPNGNVFVCNAGDHTIMKVSPSGVVSPFVGSPGVAGTKDGDGTGASFNSPSGIARAVDGTLYVADTLNHAIRKITSDGKVTTIAGKLGTAGAADGTGDVARFNEPYAVIVDGTDTLYVADFKNYAVRKVTISTGTVSTVVGVLGSRATYRIPGDKQENFGYSHGNYGGRLFGPIALNKLPDGRILVVDPDAPSVNYGVFVRFVYLTTSNNSTSSIMLWRYGSYHEGKVYSYDDGYILEASSIRRFPATSGWGGWNVGTTSVPSTLVGGFSSPWQIVSYNGTLYVSDTNNNAIKKVTTSGTVSVLVQNK